MIQKFVKDGIPFGTKKAMPLGRPNDVRRGLAPRYVLKHRRKRFKYLVTAEDNSELDNMKIEMPFCKCDGNMKNIISTYTKSMRSDIKSQIKFWCREDDRSSKILACLGL